MTKALGLFQLFAVALQGAPEVINIIPTKYHPIMHFATSLGQAAGWFLQRNYNPDSTKAEVAYVKDK